MVDLRCGDLVYCLFDCLLLVLISFWLRWLLLWCWFCYVVSLLVILRIALTFGWLFNLLLLLFVLVDLCVCCCLIVFWFLLVWCWYGLVCACFVFSVLGWFVYFTFLHALLFDVWFLIVLVRFWYCVLLLSFAGLVCCNSVANSYFCYFKVTDVACLYVTFAWLFDFVCLPCGLLIWLTYALRLVCLFCCSFVYVCAC